MKSSLYRKRVDITNIDSVVLSYIAGFFDGEGTIIIKNQGNSYVLNCGVWQVDRTPLDYVALYFGGNVRIRRRQGNGNDQWVWQASSIHAADFLTAIEPYLIVKKAQATVAIRFQSLSSSNYSKHRLSESELAIREAERILIKALKHVDVDSSVNKVTTKNAVITNQKSLWDNE
jgi:hypothetical protein